MHAASTWRAWTHTPITHLPISREASSGCGRATSAGSPARRSPPARGRGRGGSRAHCARRPESMRRSLWLPPAMVPTVAAALVAPRPIRSLARVGVGIYGAALLAGSARVPDAGPADRAALPLVFATMHGAWGAGFLAGAA